MLRRSGTPWRRSWRLAEERRPPPARRRRCGRAAQGGGGAGHPGGGAGGAAGVHARRGGARGGGAGAGGGPAAAVGGGGGAAAGRRRWERGAGGGGAAGGAGFSLSRVPCLQCTSKWTTPPHWHSFQLYPDQIEHISMQTKSINCLSHVQPLLHHHPPPVPTMPRYPVLPLHSRMKSCNSTVK